MAFVDEGGGSDVRVGGGEKDVWKGVDINYDALWRITELFGAGLFFEIIRRCANIEIWVAAVLVVQCRLYRWDMGVARLSPHCTPIRWASLPQHSNFILTARAKLTLTVRYQVTFDLCSMGNGKFDTERLVTGLGNRP